MPEPAPGARGGDPVRVMIVEDSVVVRGLIARWLESDGDVRIVRSVSDGAQAVAQLKASAAEVVILDIEMPVMNGLEALPKLLAENPAVKVVISSTLTRRNAQVSLTALSLGASDYIAKPESTRGVTSSEDFRREIVEKVKALGAAARGFKAGRLQSSSLAGAARDAVADIRLRNAPIGPPSVIGIGSSTGGPQALLQLMGAIGRHLSVPILLTQHMPATFTAILAEQLGKTSGRPAKEAETGDVLEAGSIYVAPGGYHLIAERQGARTVLRISDEPPENFCRPSVDPMFRSLASVYGPGALGVVLTGMGHDGREGARCVAAAGGSVIVQDQPTSVVWGMPGAVAEAGLASAILPLGEIAPKLTALMKGKRT
jgi:two-component system chemotaxis response regulator CheB